MQRQLWIQKWGHFKCTLAEIQDPKDSREQAPARRSIAHLCEQNTVSCFSKSRACVHGWTIAVHTASHSHRRHQHQDAKKYLWKKLGKKRQWSGLRASKGPIHTCDIVKLGTAENLCKDWRLLIVIYDLMLNTTVIMRFQVGDWFRFSFVSLNEVIQTTHCTARSGN